MDRETELAHRTMENFTPELQAALALKHVLERMFNDDRVYHLMGDGSRTFELVTEAYASLLGTNLAELRRLVIGDR